MHRMIPIRGVLQEARVTQEVATPIYIDSSSTTFVATNRAAPKKSTWVRRKSEELGRGQRRRGRLVRAARARDQRLIRRQGQRRGRSRWPERGCGGLVSL